MADLTAWLADLAPSGANVLTVCCIDTTGDECCRRHAETLFPLLP
jgi:hypothetical protein